MLLQRLLLLLPENRPDWAWFWWVALVGGGVLFWIAGARVSRSLITLLLVAAGALLGKHLPALTGIRLDPMACTLGAALVLGVLGYLFHRFVVALGLAAILGTWAMLACWTTAREPGYWTWPDTYAGLGSLSGRLPSELAQMMLALGGLGLLTGFAVAILFPRTATTLLWTLLGASIWCSTAIAWAFYEGPDHLARLPITPLGQGILLAIVIAAGFVAQWWQGPGVVPQKPAAPTPAVGQTA